MNQKQEVFVNAYLRTWNATKAAIEAGYATNSARQQGSRLLSNADIQAAIAERLNELKLSADEVLVRLGEHARGSMGHFVKIDEKGAALDLKQAADAGQLHLIKKITWKKRTTDSYTEIEHSIELYDAQAALQLIGKHHRLFERAGEDDWRSQAIESIRKGEMPYEILAGELGTDLATELFRTAGVPITSETGTRPE